MKSVTTYRPWLAALLALLIAQVTLLPDLHHLLLHQHEETAHCDSDQAHLHGSEYAHADCLICFFHFAPLDFEEGKVTIQAPEFCEAKIEFSYQDFYRSHFDWHYLLRGPPCLTI